MGRRGKAKRTIAKEKVEELRGIIYTKLQDIIEEELPLTQTEDELCTEMYNCIVRYDKKIKLGR